jgi:hypothetical protein
VNRSPFVLASAAAALLLFVSGCGSALGIHDQHRPHIVSVFPAEGQVLPAWLGEIHVTFDEPVTILDLTAVALFSDTERIIVQAYADPTSPNAILVLPLSGHFTAGEHHSVGVHEGAVVNAEGHYLENEFDWNFFVGPRPNVFAASNNGNVYELHPETGIQVAVTAPPAGFLADSVIGSDDEVFVWLKNTGAGSDALAYFVPGAATMTLVPLTGETGFLFGMGFALAPDSKTLYVTARDAANQKVRVHRVSTATRTETLSSLELTPLTPLPALTRRPAVDLIRNHLFVAHADGAGAGLLSVVDLKTFTQMDATAIPGLAAEIRDGAGNLDYGPFTDRIWMTLPERPSAALDVIDPVTFAQFGTSELGLTQGPISSILTPDERFFVQGLSNYSATQGLVYSQTSEIGNGFPQNVLDDVGGVLQGSNKLTAIVYDPGSFDLLAFASNGTSTVMCVFDVFNFDVVQIDEDLITPGVQGVGLAASAPGTIVSATFLRGALPP